MCTLLAEVITNDLWELKGRVHVLCADLKGDFRLKPIWKLTTFILPHTTVIMKIAVGFHNVTPFMSALNAMASTKL